MLMYLMMIAAQMTSEIKLKKHYQARSVSDIKLFFIEKAMECRTDHSVTSEELHHMKNHNKVPESDSAKCLLACIFRKVEWLDEKGMFDEENALKMSKKEFPDDKERQESARKLYAVCKKVNEETVGDGEKGCERSSLLATCLLNNAAEMGFHL
ncbi:general odorant-binding protein 19d [Leptidea sinapis]|uniref:general odorant-binding protein 19d n=1 Tax=Leptidea sinapis TaxID=189913 RepID=UPI0021C450AF|nr:general odorant-binding protein 19d [Leptidea sinapis]